MENFNGIARTVGELKEMLSQLPDDASLELKHIFVDTYVGVSYAHETNTVTLR